MRDVPELGQPAGSLGRLTMTLFFPAPEVEVAALSTSSCYWLIRSQGLLNPWVVSTRTSRKASPPVWCFVTFLACVHV